jgi:hypothetical protein
MPELFRCASAFVMNVKNDPAHGKGEKAGWLQAAAGNQAGFSCRSALSMN